MGKGTPVPQWSTAWNTMLERVGLLSNPTANGTTRQRNRLKRIEVLSGYVHAEVQDQNRRVFDITVRFAPLSDADWAQLIERLESQLQSGAQRSLDDLLRDPGSIFPDLAALLLPATREEIQPGCSGCQAGADRCPVCTTVYRQIGVLLDEEPILLLRLRGREWQALQQALQERRGTDYWGESSHNGARNASAHNGGARNGSAYNGHREALGATNGTASQGSSTAEDSLEMAIDHFWGSRQGLENLHYHIAAPTIELAVLRRLGPLPTVLDHPELHEQMAAIYREVTRQAQALAYSSESDE